MHLLLNGGGTGTQVKDARKKLNNLINHNKKILYIPLAWPDQTYKGCLEFMINELSDVKSEGIEMITTPEDLKNKDFYEYACIYIGGGNTFKLLKLLKESKCVDKIKEYLNNGGIVYGGSAGAIIFGKDLDSCKIDDSNDVNLIDIEGFDMLKGYSILCHYTNGNTEKTNKSTEYLLELSKIKPIYAIPEEDTIYVNNKKIEVFGSRPYYIFKDGKKEKKEVEKITYRKAIMDDAYQVEYVGAHSWYESYQEFMPKEYLENRINTVKDKIERAKDLLSKTNTYYVAEVNGKIVGILYYKKSQSQKYKDYGYLDSLYVLKEYQGQGIGKQLFKIAIEELTKLGCKNMYLECIKENSTINFYKKYRGKIIDTIKFPIRDFVVDANIIVFEDINSINKDLLKK